MQIKGPYIKFSKHMTDEFHSTLVSQINENEEEIQEDIDEDIDEDEEEDDDDDDEDESTEW